MLGVFESVLHGVLDIPYLVVGFFVDAINGVIVAIATLASLILSLLPSFPSVPSAPGGVMGAVLWAFPLGTMVAVWMTFVGLWVAFLGFKVAMKWVKLL